MRKPTQQPDIGYSSSALRNSRGRNTERTFRIFGLGGSTVHGRPYENDTSFLKWMELELSGRDSTRDYETVNCGGLSYASYRLTTLLSEVLQYDPDLIVIAHRTQ